MKKMLVLTAIIAVLSIMFCGCGSATTVEEPVITEDEVTFEEEMDSEPVIEEPAVDVDWQTLTYQWEDASGYTFEATVRVSPWINTKNETYVNAAWDEVGQGNSLPTFDPNERAYYNGKCGFDGIDNLTDMYYCMGEVSVKNITPGWDITPDNPIAPETICLSPVQEADNLSTRNSRTVAKTIYSNEIQSDYTWSIISPWLHSNDWGTVPFVFAHYDRKTPKYPNGEYFNEMADRLFYISNSYTSKANSTATVKLNIIEEEN